MFIHRVSVLPVQACKRDPSFPASARSECQFATVQSSFCRVRQRHDGPVPQVRAAQRLFGVPRGGKRTQLPSRDARDGPFLSGPAFFPQMARTAVTLTTGQSVGLRRLVVERRPQNALPLRYGLCTRNGRLCTDTPLGSPSRALGPVSSGCGKSIPGRNRVGAAPHLSKLGFSKSQFGQQNASGSAEPP